MKLSIITINYNNREGLRKTIESVIHQTFTDYEYIIIDGGSTDGSRELIEQYQSHLSYWCSEPDKGIYNAMNKGVQHAHGEYVNFMNSGDCLHNDNTLKEVFEGKAYDEEILIGQVLCVGTDKIANKHIIGKNPVDFWIVKIGFCHQGAFIPLSLQKKHLYDEGLKIVSDWKFWLQSIVFDNNKVCNLNQIVADYDMTGISSDSRYHDLMNQEREQVMTTLFSTSLRDVFNELDNIHHSIYYMRLIYLKKHSPLLYNVARSLLAFLLLLLGVTNKKLLAS